MSKGAFAKEGHYNTPPVPEVLFHLLPFQADWKAEFPPLHQCGREMKILSEKFAFTKNLTSQEKSVCRYHRKFMAFSQRLPAPEQTLMRALKKSKVKHMYLCLKIAKFNSVLLSSLLEI